MKILDRYIRNTIFTATAMVSAVIIGLEVFLALIQQFQSIGENNYTIQKAFWVVFMELPVQFYQLFPMVGFLGAIIGLGRLSSTSQLIIIRTSGVSILGIAWSTVKAAIVMIIIMTILGEGLGPVWQQQAEKMRVQALADSAPTSLLQSIWLHQGNRFIHIGKLEDPNTLSSVTQYAFSPDGQLLEVSYAAQAQRTQGNWTQTHIKTTVFKPNHIEVIHQQQRALTLAFRPTLQMQMKLISAEQSMLKLHESILYRQSVGLSTNEYIFTFYQRLIQPLTTLVMICLAVPFVFGSFRSTSMGMRIIAGVLIGFIFYMLNQLFGPISLVYQFPPVAAAALPTGIFLLVMIVFLARSE